MRSKIIISHILIFVLLFSLGTSAEYHTTGDYETLEGEKVPMSTFEGQPLMIEAIQTSCGHCRDPGHRSRMNQLASAYTGQANFLMLTISGYDSVADMEEFIDEFDVNWKAGFDIEDILSNQFEVTGTPTTVLLYGDGSLANKWVGHHALSTYTSSLNQVLDTDVEVEDTFTDTISVGGTSEPSIIEEIFSNPLFQGALIISTLLFIYVRSTSSNIPEEELEN